MRKRGVALALVALVAAGCGSTVETTGDNTISVNGSSGASSGSAPTANAGLNGPTQPTGSASEGSSVAVGGGATSGTSPLAGGSAVTAGSGLGSASGAGPGVTATTITLGVSYYQSAAAANAALGARGVDTGDPVAATKVLLNAINKAGGIAGRRVKALYFAIDPQSSTPYATEAQAECTYFTQDHKVFALIDGTPAADARRCLAQRGVADLRASIVTAALAGNELDAYTSLLARSFAAMVNYAYSQGYFPRYGGTSGNAWQVLLSAGDIQAKTLQGAMGIGWQPLFDVSYQEGDGVYSTPARHRCFALFAAAGMPHTDAGTAGGQAEACDIAFLLGAALHGYTGPVNLSVLLNRAGQLGTSYPLASGFLSRFGPAQHDGNGAYLAMQFDNKCGCISYIGTIGSMPTG